MHFCGTEIFPCRFNKSTVQTTNYFIIKTSLHFNTEDTGILTCKALVAQAPSADLRSTEPAPTPTAATCSAEIHRKKTRRITQMICHLHSVTECLQTVT